MFLASSQKAPFSFLDGSVSSLFPCRLSIYPSNFKRCIGSLNALSARGSLVIEISKIYGTKYLKWQPILGHYLPSFFFNKTNRIYDIIAASITKIILKIAS